MELAITFLPLIASIISGFFGRFIGDRNSEIVTSLLVSISALLSIYVFYQVMVNDFQENIVIATWINSGELNVNWSMNIDPLSAVMLVVVTSVSADTEVTTTNITAESGSIFIDQFTFNSPELIHVAITIFS